jgi:hypothetical protein
LSTQELLQNSIVTRNLQELGVDSIEALQYLFPEKTPEERAAMLGGFPFRMVEATQRSIGIFIDLMRAWAPKAAIQLIYAATEAPIMQWFVDDAVRGDDARTPIGYPLPGNALAIVDSRDTGEWISSVSAM